MQNSARALWLQGEELRNSVEQQRALVEVSREQLNAEYAQRRKDEEAAERAAQPQLTISGPGGSYSGPKRHLRFTIHNGGPTCTNALLYVEDRCTNSAAVLTMGQELGATVVFATPDEVTPLNIQVLYTDERGNRRRQQFYAPVDETGGPNGDRTLGPAVKYPGVKEVIETDV